MAIDRTDCILSDKELVTLINEAVRPRSINVALGGRLENVPGNEWAFKRVEEMRNEGNV
ncbi:MAG: hypothetical protein ABFD50_12185 [Smithella sp.]